MNGGENYSVEESINNVPNIVKAAGFKLYTNFFFFFFFFFNDYNY
jgi:hypothetical protein